MRYVRVWVITGVSAFCWWPTSVLCLYIVYVSLKSLIYTCMNVIDLIPHIVIEL